jgi:dTMP kinase
MNCKIIAIEGIDGAGKTYQTNLLKNKLDSLGKTYHEISFPDYKSFFGLEIGKMLSGKLDFDATSVDPKSMSLWYAMDRAAVFKNFDWQKYDFLILNRYTLSNAVYQGLRFNQGEPLSFANWVFDLEFNQLSLPKPDIYILLDISYEISKKNILSKGFRDYVGNNADVYEDSKDMMQNARNLYIKFSKAFESIHIINCSNNNDMIDGFEIHQNIIDILKNNNIL